MSFPSSHATVYRNEVGEVLGWDEPSYGADQDERYDRQDAADCAGEAQWDVVCDLVAEMVFENPNEYTTAQLVEQVSNSFPRGGSRVVGSLNATYMRDALSEVQAVRAADGTWSMEES